MSFLRPVSWFRNTKARETDRQSGAGHIQENTVVNCRLEDDADGFAFVDVRPMTYAEASCTIYPSAEAKVNASEIYSSIDESALAVQLVNQYERQITLKSQVLPSTHVMANIDMPDSYYEQPRRKSHSKSRRRSRR